MRARDGLAPARRDLARRGGARRREPHAADDRAPRAQHPDWQLRFIMGADLVVESSKWYGFDRIVELAPPIVLGRVGVTYEGAPPRRSPGDLEHRGPRDDRRPDAGTSSSRSCRATVLGPCPRERLCSESMKVFIFGAGKVGRALARALREHGRRRHAPPGAQGRPDAADRRGHHRPRGSRASARAHRRGPRGLRRREEERGRRPQRRLARRRGARRAARRVRGRRADAPDDLVRLAHVLPDARRAATAT